MKATIDGTVAEIADFFTKRSEVMALKDELMAGLAMLKDENAQSHQRETAIITALSTIRDQNAALSQKITELQAQVGDAIPQEALTLIAEIQADADKQQAAMDAVLQPTSTVPGGEDTAAGGEDTQPGGEGEQPQA